MDLKRRLFRMTLETWSFSNPNYTLGIQCLITLLVALFCTRYILTRKTWITPLLLIASSAVFLAPIIWEFDLWQQTNEKRILLVSLVMGFFVISPFIHGFERKRKEYIGKLFFSRVASEIQQTVKLLSKNKTGALIAIERHISLSKYIESGILVKGEITKEVLSSLFTPDAPTHEGGVIIAHQRIAACRCVFPESENHEVSESLGARYRAGLGLSEKTDALVIIVSGDTGEVSIASHGEFQHDVPIKKVQRKITKEMSKAKYKLKLKAPLLPKPHVRIEKDSVVSSPSFSFKLHLIIALMFFVSLFLSFFPYPTAELVSRLGVFPWISFPFLEKDNWNWIYFMPALTSVFLGIAILSHSSIHLFPESHIAEKRSSFLGIPLWKSKRKFEELKGLYSIPSKQWKNLYQLHLVRSSFKSWCLYETKSRRKLTRVKEELNASMGQFLAIHKPDPIIEL